MLKENDYFQAADEQEIINIRRELHKYPEVGFDLPHTIMVVKRELDAMGIEYSEAYGPSSIVATINAACNGHTIGLRADMDALPIDEKTDLPFKSRNEGKMHACGHDGHTAMLLGAARALKRAEADLECRVKLLFQPSEECDISGAQSMVEHGVMGDIDEVIGIHVNNELPTGTIGYHAGNFQAGCHPYVVEFFGRSVHATQPQNGADALAMAVKAYQNIYLMKCREVDPFSNHVLSISSLQSGHAHNIIADYAKMLITVRFYDLEIEQKFDRRIKMICRHAAEELGGTCQFTDAISAYPVINDHEVTQKIYRAARKVVGNEKVVEIGSRMSSEDFSHFSRKKPGAIFHLGTGNEAKECVQPLHDSGFTLDEAALLVGSRVYAQYALDYSRSDSAGKAV